MTHLNASTEHKQPRHTRLFELIRQQNLFAEHDPKTASEAADLTDAQSFIAHASSSLGCAG